MEIKKNLKVEYSKETIKIYDDLTYILNMKKNKDLIKIEIKSTLIGTLSMDIPPDLLEKCLKYLTITE